MSAQSIYLHLRRAGMSAPGACGMLGNMQAESALRAGNVQDGMGYTDEDYIAAADAGLVDFVGDGRGFGLCQWTYGARKKKLLDLARSRGVSIADEETQLVFCVRELREDYPALWLYLSGCKGVYEAAKRICLEYERPAVNNVEKRAQYANEWFMRLGGVDVPSQSPAETAGGELPLSGKGSHPGVPPEGEPRAYWPPRTLEFGMSGPDVAALQGLLIAHGFPAGVSGVFDAATAEKLTAFQRFHELRPDGIAGKLSWRALTEGAA